MNPIHALWHEEDGVLSFEWTLLVTLLVIGVVGGLAAARDAIIDELGDAAHAMLALDHSMTVTMPLSVLVHDGSDPTSASDSAFVDALLFEDCARANLINQAGEPVTDDTEVVLRAHTEVARQHRFGRHEYTWDEFALERGALDERFSAYRQRFAEHLA